VQSQGDFVFDVSRELLAYAHRLPIRDQDNNTERVELSEGEETRLREIAHRRKRKRIEFFSTESGRSLRLCSSKHEQRHSEKALWCALCGKQASDSVGHRSKFWCTVCTVHLCVRTYSGTRRSCWSMWHSQRTIKLRDSQRNQLRARETKSGEARAAHETEEAHPQNDAAGAARGEQGTEGAQH
jgi:hypothetical protein